MKMKQAAAALVEKPFGMGLEVGKLWHFPILWRGIYVLGFFCWLALASGSWLLTASGFWLLAFGFWLLLASGFFWLLASSGFWLLASAAFRLAAILHELSPLFA